MSISVKGVHKRFGNFVALGGVDLDVAEGEFVALLGPSGSGKTTLLRIIAGLEAPSAGSVELFGQVATATHVSRRGIGFVFQHFALFRHMSVFENVAFGLRVAPRERRPSEREITERVTELIDLVQLSGFAHRLPSQLSGGQRQRVALARALATQPRVLLLDEPFGALDARVRLELRNWMRELHDRLSVTSVMVTHDQDEALELADRVVVMDHGQIEQIASPTALYDQPETAFVMRFLGGVTSFRGEATGDVVRAGPFAFRLRAPFHGPVEVGVREFEAKVWAEDPGIGTVTRLDIRGDRARMHVRLDDGVTLAAQFPRRSSLLAGVVAGARVHVHVTRAFVFGDGFRALADDSLEQRPPALVALESASLAS